MLQALRDNLNIVVNGQWNVSIFSPKWLADNVFSEKSDADITFEFSVQSGAPRRILVDDVVLIPTHTKLVLTPGEFGDAYLKKAEDAACMILAKLPHTPVSAVGVNFGYKENDVQDDLLQHMPDSDEGVFASIGLITESRKWGRVLKLDGQVINLDLVHDGDLSVYFNFHTDVETAEDAIEAIKGCVLEHKNLSKKILAEVFGLTEE